MTAPVRTPDDAYQAGQRAAADAPPLTEAQVTAVHLLVTACPVKAKAA